MMRPQSGVALVLVLWVITLLAVIAGNFAFSMRGEAQIAHNLLVNAQVKMQADAGVQLAWFELIKPLSDAQRWPVNGIAREFTMDGATVRVSLLDESGKIDLNTAPDELLKGLFRSAGLSEDASANLLNTVLDWRSPGDFKRLNGAKEEDYRVAGKNYGPPNAPFETVDELQRVLGVTPELYARLAPALTVYSKRPGINPAFAPREVLLALPGMNPAAAEQYIVLRQQAFINSQPAPPLNGASALSAGTGLSSYLVRSEATMTDGTAFIRRAIVRATLDSKQPIVVLTWSEGDAVRREQNSFMLKN